MRSRRALIAAVALASLAPAAPAAAADTFADAAIGNDANECTSATAPCETVGAAVGKSGTNDTIRVAPGIYAEQLEVGGGRSLRATGTAASTVLSPPASPAVDVTSAAGTIEGFTIHSGSSDATGTMRLQAPATVRGNIFGPEDGGSAQPLRVRIEAGAGAPTIRENSFLDDGTGRTVAIRTLSTAAPVIAENRVDGFFGGIEVTGGSPEVSHNLLTGTHNAEGAGQGSSIGIFTGAVNVAPVLTGNVIRGVVTNGLGTPNGISIMDFVSGGAGDTFVGATLRRNQVRGGAFGVEILGTVLPVTLDSDLITGTTTIGFSTSETVTGSGDVTATNLTMAGNVFDMRTTNALLTLNSVILEDPIQALGSGACSIGFSRLSATPTAVASCDDAATTADPMFVDSAGGDFHLQGGSALRNIGDPAAPPAGSLDFDGEPRQNTSCLPGAIRRDIGADETIGGGCDTPDTEITSGPQPGSATAGGPSARSPEFGFGSGSFNPTFGCSIDGGFFVPCASPRIYRGLAGGSHTFRVHTIDSNGTRDDTPATQTFEVDGTPPDTQISEGPAEGSTSDAKPAFALSSEPGATFECSLDRGPFAPCGSTFEPGGLADGEHRLTVRAVDAVGNADPTATVRIWSVDGTPPETTIDSGPADGSTTDSSSATYAFSASEPGTFECSLDDGAFEACTTPRVVDLPLGAHTFAVRAIDGVGNVDGSPATRSLTVRRGGGEGNDTDPPETTIRRVKVKGDDAKAKFSSDEPGSTFECKLDRKRFRPCRSPRKLKNLDDGRHRLKVRAIDPAGNRDSTPAKKRFGV